MLIRYLLMSLCVSPAALHACPPAIHEQEHEPSAFYMLHCKSICPFTGFFCFAFLLQDKILSVRQHWTNETKMQLFGLDKSSILSQSFCLHVYVDTLPTTKLYPGGKMQHSSHQETVLDLAGHSRTSLSHLTCIRTLYLEFLSAHLDLLAQPIPMQEDSDVRLSIRPSVHLPPPPPSCPPTYMI